jgi:hypothetical protein
MKVETISRMPASSAATAAFRAEWMECYHHQEHE